MTDRKTDYFGELIPETDLLQAQQFAMTGQAYQAQAFLGTGTVVDGFTCIPTTPASLNVQLTPGTIYSQQPVEATTWSSLPTNSESILKQGILHTVDTIGITPPGTVGFSQVFLIETQYADLDTTPVLLPYFNAANPAQPFQGPNNSGQSQNTVRLGIASVQVKAGIAAATGSQVAPTPDAGWTGLFLVTVANGATTITAGNITPYTPSSFIPALAKLPALPSTIQNQSWVYVEDSSGAANTLTLAPSPPFTAYVKGQRLAIKVANTNTGVVAGAVSGLSSQSFTRRDGTALQQGDLVVGQVYDFEYNGTNWAAMSFVQSEVPRNVANPTLFVRTDGNDNNDGLSNSAAHSLRTIAAAFAKAANVFNLTGRALTITLGIPGTYDAIIVSNIPNVIVNCATNAPSTYFISGNQPCVVTGSSAAISGVTFNTLGAANHWAQAVIGGNLTISNCIFSGFNGNASTALMSVAAGGTISLNGNITCAISAGFMFNSVGGAINVQTGITITQSGSPAYGTATASATDCGSIVFGGSVTMSGSATGKRYSVTNNAFIDTLTSGNVNFFPGSIAGTTNTGGGYN